MSKRSNYVGWIDYTQKYGDREIRTVNPDVQSGSTVLFNNFEDMQLALEGNYPGVDYGTHGLSTQKAFEEAICKLENGHRTYAFPSGINAITSTLMAFTQSGDEVLVCDNVYGPTKEISEKEVLKKIDELNDNSEISGILVQLPLPSHILSLIHI